MRQEDGARIPTLQKSAETVLVSPRGRRVPRRRRDTSSERCVRLTSARAGLLGKLLTTGFQATNIGLAVKEIERMRAWRLSDEPVKEDDDDDLKSPEARRDVKAKIFLGFTSNMISSGVREVIRYLVQHKHVDVIVTTRVNQTAFKMRVLCVVLEHPVEILARHAGGCLFAGEPERALQTRSACSPARNSRLVGYRAGDDGRRHRRGPHEVSGAAQDGRLRFKGRGPAAERVEPHRQSAGAQRHALPPSGASFDESPLDSPWGRIAAAPRGATWIFCGEEPAATPHLWIFRGDERLLETGALTQVLPVRGLAPPHSPHDARRAGGVHGHGATVPLDAEYPSPRRNIFGRPVLHGIFHAA